MISASKSGAPSLLCASAVWIIAMLTLLNLRGLRHSRKAHHFARFSRFGCRLPRCWERLRVQCLPAEQQQRVIERERGHWLSIGDVLAILRCVEGSVMAAGKVSRRLLDLVDEPLAFLLLPKQRSTRLR